MREEREPRDRPPARLRDLPQELHVLVAHRVHAAGVQDDLDRSAADVVEPAHHADQLLPARVTAGQRPPLIAHVVARRGGGEAERARLHRLPEEPPHGRDLVPGGRPLERGLAHHVVPQGGERHEARDVDAEPATIHRVEVLAVALPLPVDARLHDVVGNGLDVDQVLHQDLARLGLHRRHAHPAVAHDDGGHPVPRRAGDERVPGELGVVVRVGVHEARRQDEAVGVDHPRRSLTIRRSDGPDEPVLDPAVAHEARRARSVADPRVPDQKVEHGVSPFSAAHCSRGPRMPREPPDVQANFGRGSR